MSELHAGYVVERHEIEPTHPGVWYQTATRKPPEDTVVIASDDDGMTYFATHSHANDRTWGRVFEPKWDVQQCRWITDTVFWEVDCLPRWWQHLPGGIRA